MNYKNGLPCCSIKDVTMLSTRARSPSAGASGMSNLKSVGHKSTNCIVRVGAVGVHLGNGSLDILRDDVTSVEQHTGHCWATVNDS
jgi:hypothetical protein